MPDELIFVAQEMLFTDGVLHEFEARQTLREH